VRTRFGFTGSQVLRLQEDVVRRVEGQQLLRDSKQDGQEKESELVPGLQQAEERDSRQTETGEER
jgi:hypothetical protein